MPLRPHNLSAAIGRRLALAAMAGAAAMLWVGAGCSDNRQTAEERQAEMLRNPFGVESDDRMDVSGGPVHRLDRDAMKKDLDNVFNP